MKKLLAVVGGFLSMMQLTKSIDVPFLKKFNLTLMKRAIFPPLFIILVSVLIFLWWSNASGPVDKDNEDLQGFVIPKGQSAEKIASRLEEKRLVKSNLAFRLYVQVTGRTKSIQAGDYLLSQNLGLAQMVDVLLRGPRELWVTYPEGLRREELAERTTKSLGMDQATSLEFAKEFMKESEGKEGFLFPDTYLFPRDVTARVVVDKLRSTIGAKVTSKMISDGNTRGLGFGEVVTLASIVERETLTGAERPIVAGILLKRLDAGWPLQTDATLQYLVGNQRCVVKTGSFPFGCDWWKVPTAADKERRSSYNTYTNTGLPPLPIANPG
ncbi:hypothetical protein CMO96_00915, partial [Candidatus Woesebacteria bacterium]|nr:hypothetical protein [Candidatus Woesebacteria bacterium]